MSNYFSCKRLQEVRWSNFVRVMLIYAEESRFRVVGKLAYNYKCLRIIKVFRKGWVKDLFKVVEVFLINSPQLFVPFLNYLFKSWPWVEEVKCQCLSNSNFCQISLLSSFFLLHLILKSISWHYTGCYALTESQWSKYLNVLTKKEIISRMLIFCIFAFIYYMMFFMRF